MAHKDKGRKGDKGEGKKRDRAKDAASRSTPVATARAAPEGAAAAKVRVSARVAPKVPEPRVSAPTTAARRVAAARVAPKTHAAEGDRPVLPADRASLLPLHQAARRRRDAAPLLSTERAEATFEIERIEVQIARVERAMDPPLV